jgi:AmmeMemoRadiSam system protein A
MESAARRLIDAKPDVVILISPHAPRAGSAFGRADGALRGTLGQFGDKREIALPNDESLAQAIAEELAQRGLSMAGFPGDNLDHGSVVPLRFLVDAGWNGPTIVLALPATPRPELKKCGEALAAGILRSRRRAALVASGDMSHALTPDSPAGYHRDGARFDAAFIEALRDGATDTLLQAGKSFRFRAAEDVVDSTVIAVAATGWRNDGRAVLACAAPFGVGYGVAVLSAAPDPPSAADLPALARRSIAAALQKRPADALAWSAGPATEAGLTGVFVTLHLAGGRLRGCMGTLDPKTPNLAAETWRIAREAAFHDPRFPALRADELVDATIEVTVLDPLEDIASAAELDPRRWGVVVSTADGRRGVLLPDIPEVTSAAEQVAIACRKAKIDPDEPKRLQRFTARCLQESPRAPRRLETDT